MPIEIRINNSPDPKARYITYAPSPCQIRQTPTLAPLTVKLSSKAANPGGGEAVFYANRAVGASSTPTLTLTLPANGSWVKFGLGGKLGKPSVADLDCVLLATATGANLKIPLMVRIRKDANKLTAGERDRLLLALAKLNQTAPGAPPSAYQTLRNMHVSAADPQEHGGPQFLPWHRGYLLDLERRLQAIDPSVALHYWRFDLAAPTVFTRGFMGQTSQVANSSASFVVLDPANPLVGWVTDSVPGILRSATFNTLTQAAPGVPGFALLNQAQTLALGPNYPQFRGMEGTPHGAAHVSFNGWISSIPTAPKDPLFFMLHSNVDRLWALWQWLNKRTDGNAANTYTGQNIDGRRLNDTMWPWNGIITPPRPNFAPGNGLPASPLTATPGTKPTVRSTIDYHGSRVGMPLNWLGFSYDDVPFDFTA
jgi:tyrosinase